jgi:hypothetical protein
MYYPIKKVCVVNFVCFLTQRTLVHLRNCCKYVEECHILFLVLIRAVNCFLTVMAAELVNAARNEDGEPERLRLGDLNIF